MTKRLLVRPDPFHDESLISYLVRLTIENGYESPREILRLFQNAGYKFNSNFPKRIYDDIEPLLELTGKSYSTLEHMIYTHEGNKKYKFLNSVVSFRMIEPCRPKFCPKCLRENRYHRMVWDYSLITVCLTHRCLLIADCPRCGEKLDIYYDDFGKCKCGFDICEIKRTDKIPESDLRVTEYISLLLGLKISKSNLFPFHNPLINFSLDEFSILMDYFSKLTRKMCEPEYNSKSKESSIHDIHHSLLMVLLIFDNFPNNYLYFVQEQISSDYFSESEHHVSTFSRYYPSFSRVIRRSTGTFIYKAFIENIYWLLEQNSVSSKRKRYMPSSKYISVAEAESNIKIAKNEFRYLLASGQLEVIYSDDLRTSFIDLESFLKVKSELVSLVSDSSLSYSLKISTEVIRQLAQDRYLPVKIESHQGEEISYFFEGDLFIRILSGLRLEIEDNREIDRNKLMTFEEIEETLNPSITALSNFIGLSLNGKIKPKLEILDEIGLRRFLFAENDVEEFVESQIWLPAI